MNATERTKSARRWLLPLTLACTGGLVGLGLKHYLFASGVYVEKYVDGRVIPIDGLAVNPHGLQSLDEDAEDDFRRLYAALRSYGDVFGKLPDDPRWMIQHTADQPEEWRVTEECFFTRDYEKSDGFHEIDASFHYHWAYRAPRANGTAKPPSPVAGERDVWVYTDVYSRGGKTVYRDGSFRASPSGYYLVLWSDGAIEKLPLSKMMLASTGPFEQTYFFLGEPGLPADAKVDSDAEPRNGRWWPPPEIADDRS